MLINNRDSKEEDTFHNKDIGKPIYKRYENGKLITINTTEDFDWYNNGRVVEFHRVVSDPTPYGYIDVDPQTDVPLDKVKEVTGDLYTALSALGDVSNVEIAYSGGRGFHLYLHFRDAKPLDRVKKELKDLADTFIADRGDDKLTTGIAKGQDMIRLDTSTLKSTGSLRVPGSLNMQTGLICTPLTIDELETFTPEQTKISKEASVNKIASIIRQELAEYGTVQT